MSLSNYLDDELGYSDQFAEIKRKKLYWNLLRDIFKHWEDMKDLQSQNLSQNFSNCDPLMPAGLTPRPIQKN